jgi:hypothetical protein
MGQISVYYFVIQHNVLGEAFNTKEATLIVDLVMPNLVTIKLEIRL